jgi:sterol desaturase/sphingolipid hydroxylase (fatty acid hydroxylase superfamily)
MEFFQNKALIMIAVLIAVFVLERIFPAVVLRENFKRLARNFGLGGLNAVAGPFIVVPLSAYASQWQLQIFPHYLPLGLLILDCWIYFWHRINHVIPMLWRFHEVHHLDESLDVTSAFRFHFGEVIISAMVRAGLIFVLGIPLGTVVVFEILLGCAAMFHHSNLRLHPRVERFLSILIVTPSIHWVHHNALRADTDSNYASVLSIWDRIFRTRSRNERRLEMKLGVEGLSDTSILRLILRPFYKA